MEDKVLETVVNGLEYSLFKDVLVKPLEPIKVKKEVAVGTGELDGDGFEKMKTEMQETESDFALGIVLAMPTERVYDDNNPKTFDVGDTIVYPVRATKNFDLFKNSQLVRPYDVIGKSIK